MVTGHCTCLCIKYTTLPVSHTSERIHNKFNHNGCPRTEKLSDWWTQGETTVTMYQFLFLCVPDTHYSKTSKLYLVYALTAFEG